MKTKFFPPFVNVGKVLLALISLVSFILFWLLEDIDYAIIFNLTFLGFFVVDIYFEHFSLLKRIRKLEEKKK